MTLANQFPRRGSRAGPSIVRAVGGLVALSVATFAVALAQGVAGSPEDGLALARTACSGCHQVETGASGPVSADVPTFMEIANLPGMTAERIAGAIVVPHPPMPQIALTRIEIANVAAYIMTLRDGDPAP